MATRGLFEGWTGTGGFFTSLLAATGKRVAQAKSETPIYDAFLSYSHAADGKLAPALQRSLQRFAKPWWKLSSTKVFRDETSLAAAHDLTDAIKQPLEGARFLILLASPPAAQSKWVGREVGLWLASKAPENILIVLTEGAIAWDDAGGFDWSRTDAIPRGLAGAFKSEPLWVDLTWVRGAEQLSERDPRFQQAVAMLAAPLRGMNLDEIAGEEVRQHRNTRRVVRAVVSAIVLLAAAAVAGALLAREGQRRAEQNLEQALIAVNTIETAVAKDLKDLAGVPESLRIKMLKEVENILESLETAGEAAAVRGAQAGVLSEFAVAYGELGSYADAMLRVNKAIDILLGQVRSHPDDVKLRAALAKSYKVHGDLLWWQRTNLEIAIGEMERSVKTYADLVEAYPGHPDADDWRLLQLRSLISVGDVYYEVAAKPGAVCPDGAACLSLAETFFSRARNLGLALQNHDTNDPQRKNLYLVARERLAKIDERRGDLARARTVYAELLLEYQRMSVEQPNNSKWQENLMAFYWRVGGIEEKKCRADLALDNYDKALDLARKLHQSEPGRLDWSRELSSSLKNSAQAHAALGQTAAAEQNYRESLEINKQLIEKQPANGGLKTDKDEIEKALAQVGDKPPTCVAVSNP
jgi:tetratricopeptide (TPR) repeat protein